jgi:ribonuclease P protein component
MLSKERRIPRLLLNELIRRPHKRFMGRLLSLQVYSLSQNSRFSFRVSKKVAKTAVQRNYLRRVGYNAVGKFAPTLARGFAAVFSFVKAGTGSDFKATVEEEVEVLLRKAQIID